MKSILMLILVFCFVAQPYSGAVIAQDEKDMEYSWGVVKDISGNRLVLTEYDYGTDSEVDASYEIAADVEFYGIESLGDISVGDEIEIDYVVLSGKDIIKTISVETEEEEYAPVDAYDEMAGDDL